MAEVDLPEPLIDAQRAADRAWADVEEHRKAVNARRRADAAQADAHKPAAVAKASELIELGAITPLRGQVFTVISSDGASTYKTHPAACTCYHRVAAQILLAA